MPVEREQPGGAPEIRAGLEARVAAVRAKDVEALLAWYAPEAVTFDLVPPTFSRGAGAVRERVQAWFASFRTAIEYEVRDVSVFVAGGVAFDHHLTHVAGTSTSGARIEMWFRETVGYRKVGDRWFVVHQHSSVPVDMVTGRPVLELGGA
jgi:ketosteroid isomerase-like protein